MRAYSGGFKDTVTLLLAKGAYYITRDDNDEKTTEKLKYAMSLCLQKLHGSIITKCRYMHLDMY